MICSSLLIYFDWHYLSYPFMLWYIFFSVLTLTTPFNSLIFICLVIAILAEIFPLYIGSGDWLYLSLLSFSINYLQLIYCFLFASTIDIIYMLILTPPKKIPFIPFLAFGYILTIYFINAS